MKKIKECEEQDDVSEIAGVDRDNLIDMIEGYEKKIRILNRRISALYQHNSD